MVAFSVVHLALPSEPALVLELAHFQTMGSMKDVQDRIWWQVPSGHTQRQLWFFRL